MKIMCCAAQEQNHATAVWDRGKKKREKKRLKEADMDNTQPLCLEILLPRSKSFWVTDIWSDSQTSAAEQQELLQDFRNSLI